MDLKLETIGLLIFPCTELCLAEIERERMCIDGNKFECNFCNFILVIVAEKLVNRVL